MVFEFHKVSNFGTTHPVVARLGIQSNDLVGFINVDELRRESRLRESAQGDKWSFCLTAGKIWPANQERA
jgi:hypothetical protein